MQLSTVTQVLYSSTYLICICIVHVSILFQASENHTVLVVLYCAEVLFVSISVSCGIICSTQHLFCVFSVNQSINQSVFFVQSQFYNKGDLITLSKLSRSRPYSNISPMSKCLATVARKKKCILTCRNFEQKRTQWSVVCLLCSPAVFLVSQTVQVIT